MTGYSPDIVYDRPEIDSINREYWEAFHTLSQSRSFGMAVGPIPISEMVAYCEMFYIHDIDDREDLVRIITAIDGVYLEHVNRER